jgi:hypothetical protein
MVTSRSVPQQIEQMFSARDGHSRFALRLLQIGHAKIFTSFTKTRLCHTFEPGLRGAG